MIYFLFYADRIIVGKHGKIKSRVERIGIADNGDTLINYFEQFKQDFQEWKIKGISEISKQKFEEREKELA